MGLSSDRISPNGFSENSITQAEIDFQEFLKSTSDRCNEGGAVPECEKSPRGSNGMTKAQRELTDDGVPLLYEQRTKLSPPPGCQLHLVAYTLTHPTKYADGSPLTKEDHLRLTSEHPQIRKTFFKELMREQGRLSIPERYLSVAEAFTNVWESERELRLHEHALFYNALDFCSLDEQGRPTYLIHYSKLDEIAGRAFQSVLGKPIDTRALGRVETINDVASLGHYMAKTSRIGRYMSKGSKIIAEARVEGVAIPRMDWVSCDRLTRNIVRNSVGHFEFQTNINELHDAVIELNAEHEETVGRKLFTTPYNYTVEDCPIVVAALFRVIDRRDRGYAINRLVEKLSQMSAPAQTEEEFWIDEFDRLERLGQVERGRELLERIFSLADTG